MIQTRCVIFVAQTGQILPRPQEVSNFWQYPIPRAYIGKLQEIAERAPDGLSSADCSWLDRHQVDRGSIFFQDQNGWLSMPARSVNA